MDAEQLADALKGVKMCYAKECKQLLKEYKAQFNSWMYHMCHGYNILLHGLGSKRSLLEEFRLSMLSDLTHIVINGFFPSITIKTILNAITEDVIGHAGNFRSPLDQVEYIKQHFQEGERQDIYLIIHNIDGGMLRGEKVQTALSSLAQIRGLHIIASIDHITE